MKMMVRAVCSCLLLLVMVGSLVVPLPATAASTQVQFQSNVGGSWTNEGFAYVNSVQYAFGQWYVFNTGTYSLYAQKTIYSGGNRYDFDRWGYGGAVTITDLYNSVSSITISGQGNVYAWYILQDFTLDVTPSSIEVQSPNTAQYSFTVTRTNIPQDQTRNSLRVDLFASGMSWSASGPSYRFEPGDATFSSQSTQSTITGTLFINTINAAAGQYTITVKGQIENANTYHEKQVSLKVNPNIPVYPDLVITDFSWTPSNPGVGQAISITYTEKNQGEGDAPSHRNALYIDGVLISNDDVDPLAAGASQTRSFPQIWTVSSGPHVVLVKADSTNVVYEGELGSDRENNNSDDKTLGSKIGTHLTVAVNPTSVPPGGGTLVTVSGKLTRTDTGAGLADRTISLTVPGQSPSANTNSAGDYSYSYVTPNLVEGSYPVSAYYGGDSTFSSCSAQTNLGVGKISSAITINLNPASISSDTPTAVAVNGKLSRSDTGAGLGGRSVKLDWPTGSTSVTTDSGGRYSYSLTVTATQNWVFQATFSGDSTYLQSSNSAVLSVGTKPDLIITDVWWSPDSPKVGDEVTFYYTEKNQGTTASGDFGSKLLIDGADTDISTRSSLAAGQSRDRQFTYQWTATAGTHTVVVLADWVGEVAESNEGNNDFSKTLTVGQATPALSVSPTSLSFAIAETQNSFTISNTGGGTLTWSLSSNQGWLTASPTSGSGNANITVNVNRNGLNSGTYSGVITVSSNGGSQTVSVSMQVQVQPQNPVLAIEPSQGPVGTTVRVTGTGFVPNETNIRVTYDGVFVAWDIVADGSGSWTLTFVVPPSSEGNHIVDASGAITLATQVPDVIFTVGQAIPVLSVSPTSLNFGTSDTAENFNIANTGGGTLTWSLSSSQSWLTASPSSGSGNANVAVNVDRSGLNSGTYSGIITVNSNGGTSTVSVSVSMQPVDKTIQVLYQGNLYTVKITVPLSRYQRATDAAQRLAPRYPDVDANLLAESIYLYYYVNGPVNDPIFRVAIYQNGQPIHDTNLKGQILDGLLTYCYLLVGAGSTDHIRLYQVNAQQWNESYQDTANTVAISDFLSNFTYLLTIFGPILDDVTKIFGDYTSEQVSGAVSLIYHSFTGTQSLVEIYGQQKANTIISILKQNNLIQTSDYNPAQLYQAFTANPSGAAQAISEIDKTVFNTDLTEDAKSIISVVIKELESAAIGKFAYGTAMGLHAYFCSSLSASWALGAGAHAAFSSFVSSGLPFALARAIGKSYVLPMANALHNAWEAMGDMAVSYTKLGLDVQSMANPSLTANAFDLAIAREAAMVYGTLCVSEFFYYANAYQYNEGQFFGRDELPGLKSSADMALANAEAWQATLQQMRSQASALAISADPESVSFDFLFPTPSNYLPTMPLADGFAVVTDSSNALLSVGDYSFTVQNGKWSSNFTHSFYVSDAKGSSYLVVVDSPTGEASIQTEQGTDISVLSYDTSEPGIISVSQEITQSTPEVSQEIAQSSTSAFLVSNTAGTVTVMPAPLTITTTSLSNGYVGSTYSAILAASGGNGTRTWLVTSGTLPNGLSLNSSTGVISGTLTSSGMFDFTIQVTDNVASTTKTISITIMIRHGVNWWLIGAIIAAVALIGGGVGLLVRRRTRRA